MALDSPCATLNRAPIGLLIPWTRATLELEKANPAWVAPAMTASLATRSSGSA